MERGADGASKNEEFLEVSMSEEKQNGPRRLYNGSQMVPLDFFYESKFL